ncbi:hypothetical protein C8J57DRAFT_1335246, partial [Mycena rebaudengoi]
CIPKLFLHRLLPHSALAYNFHVPALFAQMHQCPVLPLVFHARLAQFGIPGCIQLQNSILQPAIFWPTNQRLQLGPVS